MPDEPTTSEQTAAARGGDAPSAREEPSAAREEPSAAREATASAEAPSPPEPAAVTDLPSLLQRLSGVFELADPPTAPSVPAAERSGSSSSPVSSGGESDTKSSYGRWEWGIAIIGLFVFMTFVGADPGDPEDDAATPDPLTRVETGAVSQNAVWLEGPFRVNGLHEAGIVSLSDGKFVSLAGIRMLTLLPQTPLDREMRSRGDQTPEWMALLADETSQVVRRLTDGRPVGVEVVMRPDLQALYPLAPPAYVWLLNDAGQRVRMLNHQLLTVGYAEPDLRARTEHTVRFVEAARRAQRQSLGLWQYGVLRMPPAASPAPLRAAPQPPGAG